MMAKKLFLDAISSNGKLHIGTSMYVEAVRLITPFAHVIELNLGKKAVRASHTITWESPQSCASAK